MSEATDIDKVRDLFTGLGVGFEEKPKPRTDKSIARTLEFRANEHDRIEGYSGFYMEMHFTADGSFRGMEVWE